MSKIKEVQLELEEQANELGFEDLTQAYAAGCEVRWDDKKARLVEPLEAAHEDWLKEKEQVLVELGMVSDQFRAGDLKDAIEHAITFIEKGEQ